MWRKYRNKAKRAVELKDLSERKMKVVIMWKNTETFQLKKPYI